MTTVRSAIHIRTGQRSATADIDRWLAQHGIATRTCDDVYEGCVLLLREYRDVPDLAFVGADWLSADECSIVAYIRQTWPQAGIVVHGGARDLPTFDLLPRVATCREAAELAEWLRMTPAEVFDRLARVLGPLPAGAAAMNVPAPSAARVAASTAQRIAVAGTEAHGEASAEAPRGTLRVVPAEPRADLPAGELAAPLGLREQR